MQTFYSVWICQKGLILVNDKIAKTVNINDSDNLSVSINSHVTYPVILNLVTLSYYSNHKGAGCPLGYILLNWNLCQG